MRLVIIYRPPPSTSIGLSVKLFLEEFSACLEHLALAPGHLLLIRYFNSVSINDYCVQPTVFTRNLGMVVDNCLSLEEQWVPV